MEPAFSVNCFGVLSVVVVNPVDLKIIIGFIILAILLIGSGLMSASEVAYFSLRPEDIEKLRNDKSSKNQSVLKLFSMPEKLLSTILVANNTINVTIVLLAAFISARLFDFSAEPLIGFIVEAIVITFLLLFFGEILPKVFASRNGLQTALFMAFPLTILIKILKPVTSLLIKSSSIVKKRTSRRSSDLSMDDLSDALELTSDELDEDEKILKGIVNFGNISVNAIMCPRIDVTAVDIKLGFCQIISVIIESGFSRIPVYSESFDNVKGILYAKDVLPYMNNTDSFKWQSLLRPPYFVPETKKINDLLKEFQQKKIHMAIVIDEYGGTSGIITLEDILEEIVGEITDESDEDEILYRKIDERTFMFEGKILLNDFLKVLDLDENFFDYVKGESETLAGLILELTGEIPKKNQVIKYGDFKFTIESADRRRIREIRVEYNQADKDLDKE
ncbi:MAG TPA: gliding motility-associated protein GldE [Bacteroidales bacterium]|nr:MAG: Magnesium and cobalt efflux protein CorC [Bacteroidetes bacterium ADurb.Bin145]HOU01927.1 gliding motility-associated protein GldE [Bacteroidales bacterium]HQG62578.1 gliding motility-associated protein GldE [Bacteroidales bacterium]HQK67299.1 gliding motility-associated protein GldE [Bacteroidales bacterium]